MIDLISIFCFRDAYFQLLQARSIERYFNSSGVGRAIYIWLDVAEPPIGLENELRHCFGGIDFELIPATKLGIERRFVRRGWYTQQAAKLLAASVVSAESYLVLDAKNHFVRPCSHTDFITDTGKGVFALQHLGGASAASFRFCLNYFGLDSEVVPCRAVVKSYSFPDENKDRAANACQNQT